MLTREDSLRKLLSATFTDAIHEFRRYGLSWRSAPVGHGAGILYQRVDVPARYDASARSIIGIRTFSSPGEWGFDIEGVGIVDAAFFNVDAWVPIALEQAPPLVTLGDSRREIEIAFLCTDGVEMYKSMLRELLARRAQAGVLDEEEEAVRAERMHDIWLRLNADERVALEEWFAEKKAGGDR